MAFIDKKDPVVLNIKLTSKGRELLSEGNLNFKYFAIGDSEIDYAFNSFADFNPFYSNILRPADKNPSLLSFIPRNLSGDPYNVISTVTSIPTIIQNTAQPLGFFIITSGSTKFNTGTDYVKQPDAMVEINSVTGGTRLKIKQAPTYLANVNEPKVGDLLLVKWTNPFCKSTTGYTVSGNTPTPYLVYKIQGINSGTTLAGNNLVITVDRNLPDFSNITGGTSDILAGAMILYDYINFSGTSIYNDYSSDYVNEAVTAFLQNCQCPTILFPFWNMSIIFTENIVGVGTTDRNYGQYKSKIYGGFVSYIQNQAPTIKKLGVIHYTNSSPSNTYAEELYQNTPALDLPTIMWHKSSKKTLGAKFTAYGSVKTLTGITRSLNTTYYDLADASGNVVGKVFNNLKLFVIEDQELLFAMSYKSNRSWTLPNYNVGINDNVIIGCANCMVDYLLTVTPPTTIDGRNGSIYVHNIEFSYGDMVLELMSGSTRLLYVPLSAETQNYLIKGLSVGNYIVNLYDLGSPNCVASSGVTIYNPSSLLKIYNAQTTPSGLNPDFKITQIGATNIRIDLSNIGQYYGTPSVAVKAYGVIPSPMDYNLFVSGMVQFNNTMTFTSPYTIYVKDYISGTTEFVVSQDYVAVETPLYSTFATSTNSDTGGTFVNVSAYLKEIDAGINPVVGTIEFSIYPAISVPTVWTTTTALGASKKLYYSGAGDYSIAIRERETTNNIVMFVVTKTITLT